MREIEPPFILQHEFSNPEDFVWFDIFKRDIEELLDSPTQLNMMSESYISQYEDSNTCCSMYLAMKKWLDEAVQSELNNSIDFINTDIFNNYADSTLWIAQERILKYHGSNLRPDYALKPLLRDKYIRHKMLQAIYPNEQLVLMEKYIESCIKTYTEHILDIKKRINNNIILDQDELDLFCDYVYIGEKYDSDITRQVVECLLNGKYNYSSVPILSMLSNYLVYFFAKNKNIDLNINIWIANESMRGYSASNDIHDMYGCTLYKRRYCSGDFLINSCDSLSITRSRKNDLYSFIRIVFHELTHSLQEYDYKKHKDTVSSLNYSCLEVFKRIGKIFPDTVHQKPDRLMKYNYVNHDGIDAEIEADQESWRQCILLFSSFKNLNDKDNKIKLCMERENEMTARYFITNRSSINGDIVEDSNSDLRILTEYVSKNPNMLSDLPILSKYFNNSKLSYSFLFNNRLSQDNYFAINTANYILSTPSEYVNIRDFPYKDLNNRQINTLISNLKILKQQNIKTLKLLESIDFEKLRYFHILNTKDKNQIIVELTNIYRNILNNIDTLIAAI